MGGGSYYNLPETIFYLLKGGHTTRICCSVAVGDIGHKATLLAHASLVVALLRYSSRKTLFVTKDSLNLKSNVTCVLCLLRGIGGSRDCHRCHN